MPKKRVRLKRFDERPPSYIDEMKIREELRVFDKGTFDLRVKRIILLRIMMKKDFLKFMPVIGDLYFEEAKMSFIFSNHIATILMCQLLCEEMLKSPYRNRGTLKEMKRVNFTELIDKARQDRFISTDDAKKLHQLRRFRNLLEHTRDYSEKEMDVLLASFPISEEMEKTATGAMEFATGLMEKLGDRL